jgi:DNA-binding transcriptional LysR family regulator
MDRIDAIMAFVLAAEEGSLAAAARRLGRSPASVTRAIAFLEQNAGVRLLQRTTRAVRLTEAGGPYLASCRRVLAELEQADLLASGQRGSPSGLLNVTAPLLFGRLHVRPLVEAYLQAWPEARVNLLLLDRVVHLVDEGMDVAVRIGHLPDSSLIAVRVGVLRRIVVASPAYLAAHPPLRTPVDLQAHECIEFAQSDGGHAWSFAGRRDAEVKPRLVVNAAEAAVASAVEGHGVTRVLSYQAEAELRSGALVRVLHDFEPPPLPVHIVYPENRLIAAKTREFIDMAVPGLRAALDRIEAALANA